MTRLSDLPEHLQKHIRDQRAQARAAAKGFIEACQSGDVDRFEAAAGLLVDNPEARSATWTTMFRQVAQLRSVHESIQQAFQLLWVESRLSSRCASNDAQLDALRVLLIPYKGPAVRLFRGARVHEARFRKRKFYGVSWSSDIEAADWFARHYQAASGGTAVLETIAPPEAIISALDGLYLENADGERMFDELEYIVDGRRLQRVTVVRRYPQISFEEWDKTTGQNELNAAQANTKR
jgi:hypothetical protein